MLYSDENDFMFKKPYTRPIPTVCVIASYMVSVKSEIRKIVPLEGKLMMYGNFKGVSINGVIY